MLIPVQRPLWPLRPQVRNLAGDGDGKYQRRSTALDAFELIFSEALTHKVRRLTRITHNPMR
jgi:hypothetical protein